MFRTMIRISALLAVFAGLVFGQAERLLEAARQKESVEGDLTGAIEQYRKIATQFRKQPDVAAQALVHMGHCQEQLGQAEARRSYERVLKEYPSAARYAAEARSRLAALNSGERATSGQMKLRVLSSSTKFVTKGNVATTGGISGNGRLMAYTDYEKGGSPSVYDTATKQHRHLVNLDWTGPDCCGERVVISRDGKLAAFTWYRKEGDQPELRTVSTDGRGLRTVVKDSGWPAALDWTPDNQCVLALFGPIWERTELRLINIADGSARVVKKFAMAPIAARVSPDGRWIAYRASDGIARVMAMDGSADRQILGDDARAQLMDWTPDGKGIVFVSERFGRRELWLARMENGGAAGEPRLLRSGMPDGITPAGLASDGRLLFVENAGLNNSYVLRLEGGPAFRLTERFEGNNGFAAYSPNGKKLAWFGLKEQYHVGGGTLVIRNLPNGGEKSVPAPAKGVLQFAPEWLGDSRSLVFRLPESGKEVLVKLDVETGESTTIAGVRPRWNSELSSDGKTYYYAKEHEGLIAALDVATGSERTILELASGTVVRGLNFSPDGRTLALAVQYRPGVPDGAGVAKSAIEICDVATSQCRALIKSADRGSLVGAYRRPLLFTPDGKAVISTTNDANPNRIQMFPLDGGPARQLVQSAGMLFDTSISPDGKSLAYTESTLKSDLWVLENFLPVKE